MAVAGHDRRRELLQEPQIVQDPEAPTVCPNDQVVLTGVHSHPVDRHRGEAVPQGEPPSATGMGEEDAELGAHEDQVTIAGMHGHAPGGPEGGEVAGDVTPRDAVVVAPDHEGPEGVVLVAVEDCEEGPFAHGGPSHHAHLRHLRHAREGGRAVPTLPAVPGHLHQAVVGARRHQPGAHGRSRQGGDVAVQGRAGVEVDGVGWLDAPLQREGIPADLSGQVRADDRPGISPVSAPEDHIGGEVEGAGIMG